MQRKMYVFVCVLCVCVSSGTYTKKGTKLVSENKTAAIIFFYL